MGSLNSDGSPKLQPKIECAVLHQGDFLSKSTILNDPLSNKGVIRTDFDSRGVVFQPGGTAATSGLPYDARIADNTVEREKFTHNFAPDGNLQQHVTRAQGIHTSISDRQAISDPVAANVSGLAGGDALGPMQTISERKVFFLDDTRNQNPPVAGWKIFNQAGEAVGPSAGTTETDSTPNEGLIGQ